MRLFLLTALTMVAFASNSILNRLALADGAIGPAGFAAIRVGAGAIILLALLTVRSRSLPHPAPPQWSAIAGLTAYMLGFSFAYVSMDAGLGALILFGVVQITMFVGALVEGDRPPLQRWIGMVLALLGLAFLTVLQGAPLGAPLGAPQGAPLGPPQGTVSLLPSAVILMALAAVGWGIYSLIGRRVTDPLSATGWNFAYSLPFVLGAVLIYPDASPPSAQGVALAIVSGGVTSALGYALWYALLPKLGATRGALSQLSAPAIALALGAVLLNEAVSWSAILSAGLILGGIAVGLLPSRQKPT